MLKNGGFKMLAKLGPGDGAPSRSPCRNMLYVADEVRRPFEQTDALSRGGICREIISARDRLAATCKWRPASRWCLYCGGTDNEFGAPDIPYNVSFSNADRWVTACGRILGSANPTRSPLLNEWVWSDANVALQLDAAPFDSTDSALATRSPVSVSGSGQSLKERSESTAEPTRH